MRLVLRILLAAICILVVLFLSYTLPSRDVVRITNTEVRRVDFGANAIFWANSGSGDAVNAVNRDVFFIEAARPDGTPMVYRNQDTGWGWPPYFKFDAATLQAQARDLVSTRTDPVWVAMRHYGWRSELISIFPNATSVKTVAGPDVLLIPWFNIAFLLVLFALFLWGLYLWRNFRDRRLEPFVDDVEEFRDEQRGRAGRAFDRLFGRRR